MRIQPGFNLLIWTVTASTLTIILVTVYNRMSLPELIKWKINVLPKRETRKSVSGSSESDKLRDIVQRRLRYLQNPNDCRNANKLVCTTGPCNGYGSIMHHVAMCLMVAYATERTLILRSKDWDYSPGGWETFFQPLSLTCNTTYGQKEITWGPMEKIKSAKVVTFPLFGAANPRPKYMMPSVPRDLAVPLMRLPIDPFAWWVGQFVEYVTRPQRHLEDALNKKERELGFTHPIVGVHIRRTDKLFKEAKRYPLDMYMNQVDEYFKTLDQPWNIQERRVYLATDEPVILKEARERYPEYLFINNYNATRSAHDPRYRYNPSSLEGIILDVHLLSKTDYLVCTFSSNVGRTAFEKMHTIQEDPAKRIYSLDSLYYLVAGAKSTMTAIEYHKPEHQGEIELRTGDQILHPTFPKHGYSSGLNLRTKMKGVYPSHKVRKNFAIQDLPTYQEV